MNYKLVYKIENVLYTSETTFKQPTNQNQQKKNRKGTPNNE